MRSSAAATATATAAATATAMMIAPTRSRCRSSSSGSGSIRNNSHLFCVSPGRLLLSMLLLLLGAAASMLPVAGDKIKPQSGAAAARQSFATPQDVLTSIEQIKAAEKSDDTTDAASYHPYKLNDSKRYRNFDFGERPTGEVKEIIRLMKAEHWRSFIDDSTSAHALMELKKPIDNLYDYDLFDLEVYKNLTILDMELLMGDYNMVHGGVVMNPPAHIDAEIYTRHPQLYPFFTSFEPRNIQQKNARVVCMKKMERMYELAKESERSKKRANPNPSVENADGPGDASSPDAVAAAAGTTGRRQVDKESPEYLERLERHRKKTKEELFDEVRGILKKRGFDIDKDIPKYLWTLSRIRVLREVKYFLEKKGRWSDRLILEVFHQDITGNNPNALSHLYGWLDDDVHHCEWGGITCQIITFGEGAGATIDQKNLSPIDPLCDKGCDVNGANCPYGIIEVGNKDALEQQRERIYCPKRRPSPPEDAVTKIDLPQMKLEGTLTSFLPHLKWLHRLNLFENKIQGIIPPSFGDFFNLAFIDLGENNIKGSIPPQMSKLKETLAEIWLENNELTFTLPKEFHSLLLLRYFDVSNNKLSNTIPHEYSKLLNLVHFRASGNALTGQLPHEWPYRLEGLDLSRNKFSGQIPERLAMAENLGELNLSHNSLVGSIPPELLKGCANLERFELQGNQINGQLSGEMFLGAGTKKRLRTLDLSFNHITGSIPTELSNLAKLSKLDLSYNQLVGTISPLLGNLANIKEFNISANLLTGIVPSSVCGETTKEKWSESWVACDSVACPAGFFHPDGAANFHGACVKCNDEPNENGSVPHHLRLGQTTCKTTKYAIGDLNGDGGVYEHEALRLIWLSMNGFEWSSMFKNWDDRRGTKDKCLLRGVSCNRNGDIVVLNLRSANLCGDSKMRPIDSRFCWGLPTEIGALEHLEVLQMGNNRDWSGTIPTEIGLLKKLKVLEISMCSSKGSIPTEIGMLKMLRELDLSECTFRGTVPTEIALLESLEKLNLSLNPDLSGPIPDNIGQLHNVKEILLSRMNLDSSLPSSFGNLTKLENLELYGNRLVGQIPNLSRMKMLKRIDIFNNQLSGSFPFSLANLPMLQIIHLKNNRIRGSLPSQLGSLGMLSWLDVSMNQLVGSIPETFIDLHNLRDLRLGGNMLSDPIPESLCLSSKVNGGLSEICGCDAIICPLGTYSANGFASNNECCNKCPDGETTQYIGSTGCQTFTQRDYLSMLYDAVGADKWWPKERKRGWKQEGLSECEWEGVSCDDDRKVIGLSIPEWNSISSLGEEGRWTSAYPTRTL